MLDDMTSPPFADRAEAGRLLGARLLEVLGGWGVGAEPVVLGLPRGGVVVAAAAAGILDLPVDVFVARKIGHPEQPEYGLGALAEGGEPVFDERALRSAGLSPSDLVALVAAERAELARRVATYRGERDLPGLGSRTVVLVDDGVATGVTARSALLAVREQRPERLVLAAPVAAPAAASELAAACDDAVFLIEPARFVAVGRWYASFAQVSDAEVLEALATRPGPRSR